MKLNWLQLGLHAAFNSLRFFVFFSLSFSLSLFLFCLASSYFARTNPTINSQKQNKKKTKKRKKNSISAVDAAVTTPTGRSGTAPSGIAKKAEAAAGAVRPASAIATLATSAYRYGCAGPPSCGRFLVSLRQLYRLCQLCHRHFHYLYRLHHFRYVIPDAPEFGPRTGRPLRVEEGQQRKPARQSVDEPAGRWCQRHRPRLRPRDRSRRNTDQSRCVVHLPGYDKKRHRDRHYLSLKSIEFTEIHLSIWIVFNVNRLYSFNESMKLSCW